MSTAVDETWQGRALTKQVLAASAALVVPVVLAVPVAPVATTAAAAVAVGKEEVRRRSGHSIPCPLRNGWHNETIDVRWCRIDTCSLLTLGRATGHSRIAGTHLASVRVGMGGRELQWMVGDGDGDQRSACARIWIWVVFDIQARIHIMVAPGVNHSAMIQLCGSHIASQREITSCAWNLTCVGFFHPEIHLINHDCVTAHLLVSVPLGSRLPLSRYHLLQAAYYA